MSRRFRDQKGLVSQSIHLRTHKSDTHHHQEVSQLEQAVYGSHFWVGSKPEDAYRRPEAVLVGVEGTGVVQF